jgi:hypothetical protein
MSFSRLNFDNDTYVTKLNESVSSGLYMIETPRVNCDTKCSYYAPGVILDKFDDGICEKELIDLDSELIGINRKSSRCPANKYLPSDKPYCINKRAMLDCDSFATEPTLMSNPKATNKETTMNRWQWLCKNPQEKVLMPFDWNISNRMVVKMNHRPCRPNLIDQSEALPPSCNGNIQYDWFSKYQKQANMLPGAALSTCDNFMNL